MHLFLGWTSLISTWNKWQVLDTSVFNPSWCKHGHLVVLRLSRCQTVHGKWQRRNTIVTQLSIPVSVCHVLLLTWPNLLELFLNTRLSWFQQIKSSKTKAKDNLFPRAHQLMLFTHCYTVTCPDRWLQICMTFFHNAISKPRAVA